MADDSGRRDRRLGWLILAAVAIGVLAADQVTKAIVQNSIPLGGEGPSAGPFEIVHARNSGFVHGVLQGSAFWIGLATLALLAGFLVYLVRSDHVTPASAAVFGLVLGGGLGNLIDRLRLSYVTDFLIAVGRGPMNVADVALTFGLLGLVTLALASRRRAVEEDPSSG